MRSPHEESLGQAPNILWVASPLDLGCGAMRPLAGPSWDGPVGVAPRIPVDVRDIFILSSAAPATIC